MPLSLSRSCGSGFGGRRGGVILAGWAVVITGRGRGCGGSSGPGVVGCAGGRGAAGCGGRGGGAVRGGREAFRWEVAGACGGVPDDGDVPVRRGRLRGGRDEGHRVVEPVGTLDTRGAWLRGWRLLAIDGFEVDLPDTAGNAEEFGYAGSGANRSAFCKARVVALAECGTHAFLAAEVDAYSVGEKTLANRLYPRLNGDELLTADRNFYSFDAWGRAARTGAALLWRAPTGLGLPVVKVLPDGTYLAVLVNPAIRGPRRERILAAASAGAELDPDDAQLVRVVEYDVPDRDE